MDTVQQPPLMLLVRLRDLSLHCGVMVELMTGSTYWYWDNDDAKYNTLKLSDETAGIAIHLMPDSDDLSYLEYFVEHIRDDYPDLPVTVYELEYPPVPE